MGLSRIPMARLFLVHTGFVTAQYHQDHRGRIHTLNAFGAIVCSIPRGAVFAHACKMGLEGIVSKRKDSTYRSGRSPDCLKMKNPEASAVKREAEEDWGR
jgi:hypothetical protein